MQTPHFRATVLTVIVFTAGCTVHQTEAPPLAGPSDLAQSVAVTATPDTVNVGAWNTISGDPSTILVRVYDSSGRPQSGQTLRLDAAPADCGQLAPRTLTTDGSGRATAVFTAPGQPLPQPECSGFPNSINVVATVVGTNYQTTVSHAASIHIMVPVVVQAPGGPVVNFTMSSNTAKVDADITFSDAGSRAAVGCSMGTFQWYFSDGITKTGPSVMHDFTPAGTYTATLVVTDSCGNQAQKSAAVTITP